MRVLIDTNVLTGDKDFLESDLKNPKIMTPAEFRNMDENTLYGWAGNCNSFRLSSAKKPVCCKNVKLLLYSPIFVTFYNFFLA